MISNKEHYEQCYNRLKIILNDVRSRVEEWEDGRWVVYCTLERYPPRIIITACIKSSLDKRRKETTVGSYFVMADLKDEELVESGKRITELLKDFPFLKSSTREMGWSVSYWLWIPREEKI